MKRWNCITGRIVVMTRDYGALNGSVELPGLACGSTGVLASPFAPFELEKLDRNANIVSTA